MFLNLFPYVCRCPLWRLAALHALRLASAYPLALFLLTLALLAALLCLLAAATPSPLSAAQVRV